MMNDNDETTTSPDEASIVAPPLALAPSSTPTTTATSTPPSSSSSSTQRVRDVVAFEGRFPSWEAFDIARKAHCEKTHTMYVCRNTVKVEVANKRRKLQVPASWEFDRKVYVCTHGYKRISRSTGVRPRQNVRYTDCKARFTAAVVCEVMNGKDVLCIKIVNQHVEHDDHPVDAEQWRNYSQNRASVRDHPYLVHEADLMRRVGSNKRTARDHIQSISGRVCTMKDMHNLYARLKKKDDVAKRNADAAAGRSTPSHGSGGSPIEAITDDLDVAANHIHHDAMSSQHHGHDVHTGPPSTDGSAATHPTSHHHHHVAARLEAVLQQFVDAHVENHVSILSADDGSNESICLASKSMKEHYQVFPELCLLDIAVCHGTELHGNQLYGFMAMDALGNSKPIFLAQTTHTSRPLLRRICQDFKRTHPKWTEMKLIVMDKLVPEVVDVLREEFPTVRILLCQFHVIKFFSSLVSYDEMEVHHPETQDNVRELLKELVFAHSERYYQDVRALLIEHLDDRLDHPLLLYLERHWEPYRRLWVSYWRLRSLEFSSFFSKGFEAFWNPLKHIFERNMEQVDDGSSSSTTTGMDIAWSRGYTVVGRGQSGHHTGNPLVRREATSIVGAWQNSAQCIATCISEVLTLIRFIEEEWTTKMLMLEMTKPVTEFSAGSVLHFLVNCMSSFGVGLVSTQLVTANTGTGGSVTIVKGQAGVVHVANGEHPLGFMPRNEDDPLAAEGTVVYFDKAKKKKHVMKRDCSGCDCEFYVVYQLPCQHLIWYEISYLHHKQLSMSAVGQRWFLRTFQIGKLVSQKESNEIEYHIL